MCRCPRHAEAIIILAAFEVEILYTGVCISIGSVETDTLQGRGDKAEIALVRELYTEQVGVTRILGLREASIYITLVFVVGTDLVYDEVIDFLVENTGTDQTDATEILVGAQVEVVRHGRFQFGISDSDFIVGALDVYARYKSRIFGT